MYADFMMFFTYGCLVRDDLIKKFKQTYNPQNSVFAIKTEIQVIYSDKI